MVAQTWQRTVGQQGAPWVSDGRLVPTPGVGWTQAIKHRCQGRVVRIEMRQVWDEPIACPYAVHEERLNGVLGDRLNCLTRKTHAFAKREQTWDAAVILCLFEGNWLRSHPALREAINDLSNGRCYLVVCQF